jgi:hypothetical protein
MTGKRVVLSLVAIAGAAGTLLFTRAACRGDRLMAVIAMAFRDDGIETIGRDGRIRFLDRHFRERAAPPLSTSLDVWAAAFSADGMVVAFADRSGVVRIRPVGGTTETAIETGDTVGGLALGPGGLVGVLADDEIRIYRDGIVVQTIRGGSDHFGRSMAFSPDGKRLAVPLNNLDAPGPVLRLFELSKDPPVAKTFGPVGCSCGLAFSPDGGKIAIAGVFGTSPEDPSFVSVLRLEDQIEVASHKDIRPHRALWTLAFDGRTIVGSTPGGKLAKFGLPEGADGVKVSF